MKLNHLFLNAIAGKADDRKNYVKDIKESLSIRKGCGKENQCVAHFLFDRDITPQKVFEMVKKKGITLITLKGVGATLTQEIEKLLTKRIPTKIFTIDNSTSNPVMKITLKPVEVSVESSIKKNELAVA